MQNSIISDVETIGDIDREPLVHSVGAIASKFAVKISKRIEYHPIYKRVASTLLSDKTLLYFQKCIAEEIMPYMLQMLIIRRDIKKHGVSRLANRGVWIPSSGVFLLLREIWPKDEIPIYESLKKHLKERLSNIVSSNYWAIRRAGKRLLDVWKQCGNSYNFDELSKEGPRIAVHFVEGLDLRRRSDIVWFPHSGIDPRRILVYFDRNNIFGKPIPAYVLERIEELGMKWVSIEKGMFRDREKSVWAPSKTPESEWLITLESKPSDQIGKWILQTARRLLWEVHFWKMFYQTFNIKLIYLPEEGNPMSIAQRIAFDTMGEGAGYTVGRGRSDFGDPTSSLMGYHTKDIFFTWNCRATEYLKPRYNRVQTQVIVGHPNDMNFFTNDNKLEEKRKQLIENGARFVIALFDTGHGTGLFTFETPDMESFYRAFLKWVLEDDTVGIVIKSKKPYILKTLPNILPLLAKAETTGRCIRLSDEFGRLPSDASRIADIAVGAGVSSAVTEAVIAGCRGIHYHKSFPYRHDYFKWGYEKIVFDDLDRMMNAIKSYKTNPDSNPDLGDWTHYLSLLDPFRDGRAGERMGSYLRWCLEGFDAGLDSEAVLQQVNTKYAEMWGADKVIDMRSLQQATQ